MTDTGNIRTIRFRSWHKFVANFGFDLFLDGVILPGGFLFRGQGDANYELRSSFDRRFADIPIDDRVRKYQRVKDNFAKLYREEVDEEASDDLTISVAQHYGLPTRLLDWSSNPFVAAYFAFNRAALSNQRSGNVVIWALQRSSKLIHHQLGLSVLEARSKGNLRANAQLGYFTHLTGLHETLEDYARAAPPQGQPLLIRFVLPVTEARTAFAYLSSVGVNARKLFPDFEGIALSALESDWLQSLKDVLSA
ncbi:FRG domain-containing protein [Solirhodobacter olei]|uniref:FRG domain-containing protein n=1 Tax=Solirhodobacter olei TaxID=2493082 RepID=UPI000FD92671|nr:FRG domain-containing protein [Solirhodobacter olei]